LCNSVVYPYDLTTGEVIPPVELESIAPNVWDYLKECRHDLSGRPYFDRSGKFWYELWCQRTPRLYTLPKIVGPEIAARGEFTLCTDTLFFNNKLKGIILKHDVRELIEYVLGIINSSLLVYLHKAIAPPKGGGFFEVKTRIMGRLPMRQIEFNNEEDVSNHDRMVDLVQRMLDLNARLPKVKTDHDRNALQRQIDATDRQIDQLVYELYGLTDKEIALVEEATG
jgi:hypothetical protein